MRDSIEPKVMTPTWHSPTTEDVSRNGVAGGRLDTFSHRGLPVVNCCVSRCCRRSRDTLSQRVLSKLPNMFRGQAQQAMYAEMPEAQSRESAFFLTALHIHL